MEAMEATVLSGEQLLAIRLTKCRPRTLPSMPAKQFFATNSSEEKEHIIRLLSEKLSLIGEERAERKDLLATAEWIPEMGLARMDHIVGSGWESFGFEKNCNFFLYPEEALFLLEATKLQLFFSSIPVSVQQAYSLLLKKEFCLLEEYQVYAHLSRLGYRVRRSSHSEQNWVEEEGPSPKKARVDSPLEPPPSQEKYLKKLEYAKPNFLPTAADEILLRSIPNLGTSDLVQLTFPDSSLIPKSCHGRQCIYSFGPKIADPNLSETDSELLKSCDAGSKPRNWLDFNADFANISQTNNPLFQGNVKPLITHRNFNHVGDLLHLLEVVPMRNIEGPRHVEEQLQIKYDVYSPGSRFRKSNPGAPNYRVLIINWRWRFPSAATLQRLRRRCPHRTDLLIAINGNGSDIAFYRTDNKIVTL